MIKKNKRRTFLWNGMSLQRLQRRIPKPNQNPKNSNYNCE